jgi:hypothetical protein
MVLHLQLMAEKLAFRAESSCGSPIERHLSDPVTSLSPALTLTVPARFSRLRRAAIANNRRVLQEAHSHGASTGG